MSIRVLKFTLFCGSYSTILEIKSINYWEYLDWAYTSALVSSGLFILRFVLSIIEGKLLFDCRILNYNKHISKAIRPTLNTYAFYELSLCYVCLFFRWEISSGDKYFNPDLLSELFFYLLLFFVIFLFHT